MAGDLCRDRVEGSPGPERSSWGRAVFVVLEALLLAVTVAACRFDPVATIGQGNNSNSNANTNTNSNTNTNTNGNGNSASCGNGIKEAGESCDGQDLGGQTCEGLGQGFVGGQLACLPSCDFDLSGCTAPGCGNGLVEGNEECDDGNESDTDACLSNCRSALCGDGFVWAGQEECDAGGVDSAACDEDCSLPQCGDGHLNRVAGEACDDGNGDPDDGCSSSCTVEDFFACSPNEPNQCHCVVYVDQDNSQPGGGQSWGRAMASLQAGIEKASQRVAAGFPFCDVWVAQGRYDVSATLILASHVHVYGGFVAGDRWYDDRMLPDGMTVLDGGNVAESAVAVDQQQDVRLDGFEVTGGAARFPGGGYGGGLWFRRSQVLVSHCVIRGNDADGRGGGFYLTGQDAPFNDVIIERSVIAGNHAGEDGGGLALMYEGTVTLRDVLLVGNSADGAGFSLYSGGNAGSSVRCINCTILPSQSTSSNASVHNAGQGGMEVRNSILWGPASVVQVAGPVALSYSDVRGWTGSGTGMIEDAPLFVDASGENFTLAPGSPCIDAADGDVASDADLLDRARWDDPTVGDSGVGTPSFVDMGAFEFQGSR